MFNLKNIFNEKSGEKVSKNTSSSFLGDGKAILDAVDDGVLAVDQKGNILAINPAAEQITGWSGSDAAGLVFNSVLKITNNDGAEMQLIAFYELTKTLQLEIYSLKLRAEKSHQSFWRLIRSEDLILEWLWSFVIFRKN